MTAIIVLSLFGILSAAMMIAMIMKYQRALLVIAEMCDWRTPHKKIQEVAFKALGVENP